MVTPIIMVLIRAPSELRYPFDTKRFSRAPIINTFVPVLLEGCISNYKFTYTCVHKRFSHPPIINAFVPKKYLGGGGVFHN